jgi:hypothetical protein
VPEPAGDANRTGWAGWSGSTFATPIVSGLATRLLGHGQAAGAVIATVTGLAVDPTPQPRLRVNALAARQLD